ncbi:hypothetical protein HWD97_02585 [Ochrobactrum sp. C6C9]|uniref:hypothetical protein n=1 Tax=Ochrobactrum sp. C6C9 TaxID=2736662 RepID=UPI0035304954|nr:hypothetical protein [Ochrobactrum sp. C6C9]
MNRFAQIACVVIFIAIMVGIHHGFLSLQNWFSSDFPLGFIVGALFTMGIFYLIHRFEARNSSRSR